MKINQMPWFNRPNTRLKRLGVEVLSDAELLAIIIGRGNPTENAIDLSNRILQQKNLPALSYLSYEEIKAIIQDDVKSMQIVSLFELHRRTNKLLNKGFKQQIKTAEDVYHKYIEHMQHQKQEHFIALYLDTKNRIITENIVTKGTLNASLIHPREIFKTAIKVSANSIILLHNHPSGDPSPSTEDEQVTKNLASVGELIGISILDHIIIGSQGFVSLKEKGVI
jgi:DNA repair protein RadC